MKDASIMFNIVYEASNDLNEEITIDNSVNEIRRRFNELCSLSDSSST